MIEPEQAVAIISLLPGRDVTPRINKAAVAHLDKKARKERSTNLDFHKMKIRNGEILTFDDDNKDVKATVIENKKVCFNNQKMSLTKATKIELGWGPKSNPRPRRYWKYNGKLLVDIPQDTTG